MSKIIVSDVAGTPAFFEDGNLLLEEATHYDVAVPGLSKEARVWLDALPLDLRFLITVFGTGQVPLTTLGQIVRALHADPTLAGQGMKGQVVRVTPEPYPMEELSRVWGLFPQDVYRTSVVYLASPVMVEAAARPRGRPVQERRQKGGLSSGLPSPFGEETEVA